METGHAAFFISAFIVVVPLLTLGGSVFLSHIRRKSSHERNDDNQRRTVSEGREQEKKSGASDLALFLGKGTLLWLLLVQGRTQLGGPIAAWACAAALEYAAQQRDRSLLLLHLMCYSF